MRFVLRLFGVFPIATLDVIGDCEEEETDSHIEAGSAHNFERDVNPVTPEDRYNWEWDDKRRFGFRA